MRGVSPHYVTVSKLVMKRLLLLGGGHSHAEVVRRFGAGPVPGAEIVLLSPERLAPYSGMLPGLIAGHYAFRECHIDLEALCAAARLPFRRAEAADLDLAARRVTCTDGSSVSFDLLSIGTGSTSDVSGLPGALEHAIRVKPIAPFLDAWNDTLARVRSGERLTVAIVGAGAAGVELAAAMHHRAATEGAAGSMRFHLLTDMAELLPGHPARVRRIFERVLDERGIEVHRRAKVAGIARARLDCADGSTLRAERIILATGPAAPRWIADAGLKTDPRGFMLVDDRLQSLSHEGVFAAGDIASMANYPRPKMGVFAVRQGPVLAENLRRSLTGGPLLRHQPQRTALALITTGDRRAVASWDGMALEGGWIWRWKDRIDRRFMATYGIAYDPW